MIYHKGRWLIAPEIKALLDKLEDMNEELRLEADRLLRENTVLREKQESADRQIAEYKRLLKAAVEGFNFLGAWMDEHGDCTLDCSDCPLHKPSYYCRGWKHQVEALALIGEDGENDA